MCAQNESHDDSDSHQTVYINWIKIAHTQQQREEISRAQQKTNLQDAVK